jgi:PAS domain-containing protein
VGGGDAHSAVSVADAQGVIRFVNDRFCENSRYGRGELLGQSYRMLNSGYHPAEFWRDLWATVLGGRIWRGLIRNRAKGRRQLLGRDDR